MVDKTAQQPATLHSNIHLSENRGGVEAEVGAEPKKRATPVFSNLSELVVLIIFSQPEGLLLSFLLEITKHSCLPSGWGWLVISKWPLPCTSRQQKSGVSPDPAVEISYPCTLKRCAAASKDVPHDGLNQ